MKVEDFQPAMAGPLSVNQLTQAGALIERLKEILRTSIQLPPKQEVLKIVADAYDTYVAPLDIPGVPEILEPWADSTLKAIVLASAGQIYDKIAASL